MATVVEDRIVDVLGGNAKTPKHVWIELSPIQTCVVWIGADRDGALPRSSFRWSFLP